MLTKIQELTFLRILCQVSLDHKAQKMSISLRLKHQVVIQVEHLRKVVFANMEWNSAVGQTLPGHINHPIEAVKKMMHCIDLQ